MLESDQDGCTIAKEGEQSEYLTAHGQETVGWMAIEHGSGLWDGHAFEAGSTGDAVNHRSHTQSFDQDFDSAPQLLANIASYDGADPVTLRYEDLDSSQAVIRLQEDQSDDQEISHTSESVDFLALEGNGLLSADNVDLWA
jgi:serralysin